MRLYVILLFFSILMMPLSGSAMDYAKWIGKDWRGKPKFADNIDELVAQYDSTACQNCHTDIYEQWKKSYHSRSIVSSVGGISTYMTVGIQTEWGRKINRAEAAKCLDCHIPQINTATEKLAKKIVDWIIIAGGKKKGATEKEKKEAYKQLERLNINCIVCHNMKSNMASIAYLRDPVREPSKKDKKLGIVAKVYSAGWGENAPHEVVQTNGMTHALFCEQCHGIWPAPDGERIQCNSLSGSYEDAYRARGGYKMCQDCHMREKNRGHSMPGGHDFNGIVKESMDLNVEAVAFQRLKGGHTKAQWFPAAVVNVDITSHAGHRIPDG